MLKEIFNFIDSRKSHEIIASFRIKPVKTFVNDLKIWYLSVFFNYELSFVVDELNNNSKLRKLCNIDHIPTIPSIQTRFSKYSVEQNVNLVNRLLRTNFKRKNTKLTFIVDATPVDVDINFMRKHYPQEYLSKINLKWSYSSSKGHYIGYKVTIVLEKNSLTPVLILIHNGAPHDTKIYKEELENLKQSRIIRPLDILLFDKGYFSYENYKIGIIEYRIIPLIFLRENYNKNKLLNTIICPLDYFKNKKENLKIRREIKLAITLLLKKN